MLILTALDAAAQSAPASCTPQEHPYARHPENVVLPVEAEDRRELNEWGYAEAVIDGDHIWLSGVVAGLRPGETMADHSGTSL
jgi:hypothetical protein